MDHKLTKGQNSNYEINLTVSQDEMSSLKDKALKAFQRDLQLPWFRKGFVPLHMVEQNVKPEYIKMWIYEEAIHTWLNKIISENSNIRFIWNIYDLNQDEKTDKVIFTFKLDIYPEVEVLNKNWETIKIEKVNDNVSDQEITDTLLNIKKQYAEYVDTDKATENTVIKVKYNILEKNWNSLHNGSLFFWEEDYAEFPALKDTFNGKAKWDIVEISYKEKEIPHVLHYHKEEWKPSKISFEIIEIKNVILPEFNKETLNKFFWDEITTEEQLKEKIAETIGSQKKEMWLLQAIDKCLDEAKTSLNVSMPQTIISEEVKSRIEAMKKRFGWEDGFNKYFKAMWEDKMKQAIEEIQTSAKVSLEKFFLFRKLVELLWLENEINWEVNLDAEKKVYEKLASDETPKKKAPAKKTTKTKEE